MKNNKGEYMVLDEPKEVPKAKPKCETCKHLMGNLSSHRGHSSLWCCEIARTECMPYREIARAPGGEQIPIKTSPRWCPLRKEKQ